MDIPLSLHKHTDTHTHAPTHPVSLGAATANISVSVAELVDWLQSKQCVCGYEVMHRTGVLQGRCSLLDHRTLRNNSFVTVRIWNLFCVSAMNCVLRSRL